MPDTQSAKASYRRLCPISGPVLGRIARDYWHVTGLGVVLLAGFHWLFVTFLPLYNMRYKLAYIKRMPEIVKAMIGPDLMAIISTTGIGSFAYVHPVSLIVVFGFAILLSSGTISGQIDRGTIDLVLSTPLSRKKFMFTSILAALASGALLIAAMLLGTWIGVKHVGVKLREPYQYGLIVVCAVNLYAAYVVVLGYSTFFSAVSTLRGSAVGWSCAVSLVVYLLHFLAEWWEPIKRISFLGPLHYFRPIKIVAGNYDPTNDILLLTGTGVALLILAVVCSTRRDITVV